MTQQNQNIIRFLPLILFITMAILFAMLLLDEDRNPQEIRSALIGRDVPTSLNLPALYDGQEAIKASDLKSGKPMVVNFFASWCAPCRAEHPNLIRLSKRDDIIMVGIAYKDKPEASKKFLREIGDPYDRIGVDRDGFRAGIDFGISGVPETFIINTDGKIVYRFTGPIVTDKNMLRFISELEKAK